MGVCAAKQSQLRHKRQSSVSYSNKPDDILIEKSISKYEQKILNNAELLLTLGYIRDIFLMLHNVPLELIYLCYKYHHIPSTEKKAFMWKQAKPDGNCPDFMSSYIQCIYLNPANMSDPMTTNIVISNTDEYIKKQIKYPSSCYIPNTSVIGNEAIQREIRRKCEEYSIHNPSTIITCGQIDDGVPRLTNINNDYCSAIIFDEMGVTDKTNNNLYGFEINLPSFIESICDDMIYSESAKTTLAYQSFYNQYNRLYYLNKDTSDWQLLTKLRWHKFGAATMIDINESSKVFISTTAGESVLVDLSTSKWNRLSMLEQQGEDQLIGIDYVDEARSPSSTDFSYNSNNLVARKPVFGYNEIYKKMYRVNPFKQEAHHHFYYDFTKNRWIQMDLVNKVNADKYIHINQQSLWVNHQSPNILYTMINAQYNNNKGNKGHNDRSCDRNIFAYYDERDCSQKSWKTFPISKINKNGHSFSCDDTVVLSMF